MTFCYVIIHTSLVCSKSFCVLAITPSTQLSVFRPDSHVWSSAQDVASNNLAYEYRDRSIKSYGECPCIPEFPYKLGFQGRHAARTPAWSPTSSSAWLSIPTTVNGIPHRSIRSYLAIAAIVGVASSRSRNLVFFILQHCLYCPQLL